MLAFRLAHFSLSSSLSCAWSFLFRDGGGRRWGRRWRCASQTHTAVFERLRNNWTRSGSELVLLRVSERETSYASNSHKKTAANLEACMTFGFLASRKPPHVWNSIKSRRSTNARRKSRFNGDGEGCEKRESVVGSGELAREEADDESSEDNSRVFSSMLSESSPSSSTAVRKGFSPFTIVEANCFE